MPTIDDILVKLDQIKTELDNVLRGQVLSPKQTRLINGLSDLDVRLGLVQAGELRAGNGLDPNHGFTGVRIGFPPFVYNNEEWHIAGVNNDVLQFGANAEDGQFYAGGGAVVLSSGGIVIVANPSSALADDRAYKFQDSDGMIMGGMWGVSTATLNYVNIQSTNGINGKASSIAILAAVGTLATVKLAADNSALTNNAELELIQGASGSRVNFNYVQWLRLQPTNANPTYEDGYLKLYYFSDGAGTDELRVRGKVGATETQVTLANITP